MKKIYLGGKHKYKGKFAIVDDEDFEYLNQFKWHEHNAGYAQTFMFDDNGKKIKPLMHRLINKTPRNIITDHINGNRLDNRKGNLRNVTYAENNWNSSANIKEGKSKYKGVMFDNRSNGYWYCQISVKGKRYTKHFETEIEAAKGYNELALKHHGEYAKLNVIEED